eukprot:UN24900
MNNTLFHQLKSGWAVSELEDERKDMEPLLEKMLMSVPAPKIETGNFRMLASLTEKDPKNGKLLVGRIHSGTVKHGDEMKVLNRNGELVEKFLVRRLLVQRGVGDKVIVKTASAGDIVQIAGATRQV